MMAVVAVAAAVAVGGEGNVEVAGGEEEDGMVVSVAVAGDRNKIVRKKLQYPKGKQTLNKYCPNIFH